MARFVYGAMALALVCTCALVLVYYAAASAAIGTYGEEERYWAQKLPRMGSAEAYTEMVQRYEALSAFQSHEYAHVFGAALYSVHGVTGFDACGPAYAWGCSHSLVSEAIGEHGLGIVKDLDAACRALPREDLQECQHGLGHGIVSYLGASQLRDALHQCELLGGTYGCGSGAIMEYLNGNIHEDRPPVEYTEGTKYGPCETLPASDRLICYRRLPNWWAVTFNGNDDERWQHLERNCLGISNERYRIACVVGLGYNETSHADYDPAAGTRLCERLLNADTARACMYGGVLAIFQNTPVRDRAIDMCPSGDLPKCVSAAERLIGASESELALPD